MQLIGDIRKIEFSQKTHYLFLLCQHFKLQIQQQSISSLFKILHLSTAQEGFKCKSFQVRSSLCLNKQTNTFTNAWSNIGSFCYAFSRNVYRSRKRVSLSFEMQISFHQPIVIKYRLEKDIFYKFYSRRDIFILIICTKNSYPQHALFVVYLLPF